MNVFRCFNVVKVFFKIKTFFLFVHFAVLIPHFENVADFTHHKSTPGNFTTIPI